MSLSNKAKKAIKNKAEKEAKTLDSDKQQPFIEAKAAAETFLNENVNTILDGLKAEASVFLAAEPGLSSLGANMVLDDASSKVKETIVFVMKQIAPIGDAALKVLMCEAIKLGVDECLKCCVDLECRFRKIAGRKET
jgi:hypothetical protein